MNNSGKFLLLAGVVVASGIAIAKASKAKAQLPPQGVLTPTMINGSGNLTVLDSYYELANELFVTGKVNTSDYAQLYGAYEDRFNELTGG